LSAEAQDYACSVRWRRARAAEPIAHDHVFIDRASSRWTAVAPGRPASLAVLGPTVLRIEARAADPGPGRTLTIRARSRSGTQTVQTFELSQRPDLMVRSASEQRVGIAIEALVNLAHAEPYQLTLETPEGRTFVRATMREDRAGEVPAAPRSLVEGPELQPVWPWRAPALPAQDDRVAAAPRVGGGGSISAVVTIGRDDITDADDFRPRNRTGLAIGWRRALGGNAWLRTQASLLGRERSGIAGGAEVLLAGVIPKAEVRGSIGTQWMAERFAGDAAWSARATGLVDRPIALAPLWRLIPRFVVAYRYQSLTEAEVDAVDEGVHPEVYTEYVEQHPWALSPEMIVRWRPFQNARVSASAGVTTNGDFQDLDHADLSVQWAAVLPSSVHIVPEYDIGYQSSFRFADEHRGAFFVRHRLSAGLGASFWVSDLGRLMIGGREVVYMSRPWPTRNAFEVWFGFEFGLGRGVTDYSPLEQRFRAFYEGRR
jgi:hypothetical protein